MNKQEIELFHTHPSIALFQN